METQKWEENHVFRRLRRHPTQKLACFQRVKTIIFDPTKDPRSIYRSLISLSDNCVLRMLLRMLSACAPGIGYLTNPIAYSGQDQDPSNETIAVV